MLSSHAAGCWILETVNFPAARCDTCPVRKIAQDDSGLPYVPDLGDVFPEVGILLHRPPSLTTDQRFVIESARLGSRHSPSVPARECTPSVVASCQSPVFLASEPLLFVVQTKGHLCQLGTRPKVA